MAEETKTAQDYFDASGDESSNEETQTEEVEETIQVQEESEEVEQEVDWKKLATDRETELEQIRGVQKSYNDIRPEFDKRGTQLKEIRERNYELEQQSLKRELAEIKGKDVQPDQNTEQSPNGLSFTTEENEFLEDAPEFRSIVEKYLTPLQDKLSTYENSEKQLLQQIDVLASDHEDRRQATLREQGHRLMESRGLAEPVKYGQADTEIPLYLTLAEDTQFKNWVNSSKARGDYLGEQVKLGNMGPVADAIELYMAHNPGYTPEGVTSEIGYGKPPSNAPPIDARQAQRQRVLEGVDTGKSPPKVKTTRTQKLDPSTSSAQDYWDAAESRV